MSERRTATAQRSRAAPVAKPFPWGSILGAGGLALVLVAVIAYAAVNAGAAAPNPLRDADTAISGVSVAASAPSQGHKPGPLTYDTTPSSGGEHNGTWNTCAGNVYDQQIPDETATHSMEHGAVWVTYRPDLSAGQVASLTELVDGGGYRMLSPYPGLDSAVSVQAWGRQLTTEDATDPRLADFVAEYSNGPQTPERGATCSSGTTATGQDPAA